MILARYHATFKFKYLSLNSTLKNSLEKKMSFLVTFFAYKTLEYSGQVLYIGSHYVTLKHKKPHSSKFIITTFPKSSLLSWSASLTEEGFVVTRPEKVELYSVKGNVKFKSANKAVVESERGAIEFDPNFATITADTKDAEKVRKTKESKPTKIILRPKTKVAKPISDEEFEQEFEDE